MQTPQLPMAVSSFQLSGIVLAACPASAGPLTLPSIRCWLAVMIDPLVRPFATLVLFFGFVLAIPEALADPEGAAAPKRVLFLAGPNSHGWGQHKHIAGSTLLRDSLIEQTEVEAILITEWPSADELAKADVLVIYADGWQAHPANDKLEELENFMNAGKGLVAIHWATGIQAADPQATDQGADPRRKRWRDLMGADFEAYHSISNFWTATLSEPVNHPVLRGIKPFSLYDECYFHLRECGHEDCKVEPLWLAHPPAETIQPGHSASRGNDAARAAVHERKEEQYIAWAFPRPNGGRAFGFTGGHFHWTWAHDQARKLVLNGILWSAGGEVPADGVESTTPTAGRMLKDLPDRNPGWTEAALQHALDRAAEGDIVRWLDYSGRPLPEPQTQE